MPCALRPRLFFAQRFARMLIGVDRLGELSVGLHAKHRKRPAVVGDRRREFPARIEHDLVGTIATRADFVDERQLAAAPVNGERAQIVARYASFPVRGVEELAVRVCPYVGRVYRFCNQPERRQGTGLRIEPEPVDAFRRRCRRRRRVRIAADIDEVITCPERSRWTDCAATGVAVRQKAANKSVVIFICPHGPAKAGHDVLRTRRTADYFSFRN